jgi:hypothetical protein
MTRIQSLSKRHSRQQQEILEQGNIPVIDWLHRDDLSSVPKNGQNCTFLSHFS